MAEDLGFLQVRKPGRTRRRRNKMLKDFYAVSMGMVIEFHREIIAAGVGAVLMLAAQTVGGL